MSKIADHYSSGTLLARLNAALADDGADPKALRPLRGRAPREP